MRGVFLVFSAFALIGCGGIAGPSPSDDHGDGDVDAGVVECVGTDDDPLNCGACGRVCRLANATAGCGAAECTVVSCRPGFIDLDGDPLNGCEDSGECVPDQPCTASCGTSGVRSCDEESLGVCEPPVEACNLIDDNCDSECDEGALPGCRRGIHRAFGTGRGHLYTTDLAAASTAPFVLEYENFFYLYATPAPGTAPVYRCKKADNTYLITGSSSCESIGTVEATLGYWAGNAACGAVPLYRLYHAGGNLHFFTHDDAQVDDAINIYGFVFQGIVGYVWLDP